VHSGEETKTLTRRCEKKGVTVSRKRINFVLGGGEHESGLTARRAGEQAKSSTQGKMTNRDDVTNHTGKEPLCFSPSEGI